MTNNVVIIMDKNAAKKFVLENARPLDLAVYKYFFENESNQAVIDELSKFQNTDGGFGHALRDIFTKVANEEGVRISRFIKEPIDGLIAYHLEESDR